MSTAIGIRFPSGRYHASPWTRHVNEADVEWPPSPLRILRALIAVWHRKADTERWGEPAIRSLVHGLAAEPPMYRLPRGVLSHTRHYMPVRSGRSEKKRLVFDAFLRIDPDDVLVVVWPNTTLPDPASELLDHLLERLGYLGRAESWAECRRLETWDALPNCGPERARHRWIPEREPELEPVAVPVAMPPEAYASWRTEQVAEYGLEKPRLVREKRLRATLPEKLIDALRLDTGEFRKAGWSRMPGTDELIYLRPEGCMNPPASRHRSRPPRRSDAIEATTARLVLLRARREDDRGAAPLPRLEDAIRLGEVLRAAAISRADGDSPVLSGHDMPDDPPHQHAFYLPEDADGDGRIDHVAVHAPAGLDDDALRALHAISRLWLAEGVEWRVLLESYGPEDDFADHPYLAPSRVWESVTPYLHPWYRKKSFTVEDQIARELRARARDLPDPELERLGSVRVGERKRRSVHFHRFRSRRGLTQPDTQGSFWRLRFPEPVKGPIALGFACHYGLGIFAGANQG